MAFGAALAGFSQGFLGGLKAGQDFYETRERTQSRREFNRKAKNENDAADEIAAVAKAQRVRGASTQAAGTNTTAAIAVPQQALTPASEPQSPEAVVAAAIPANQEEEQEQRGYAEGGLVRPEDQPPAAIAPPPMAAPAPAAPPAAITPPSNAPAAPPANYNDPELKDKVPDPVTGGLNYMREAFGLNGAAPAQVPAQAAPAPGAIPTAAAPGSAVAPPQAAPDPQRMQGLTAMQRGEGAATNEEVAQAARRVDPKGEMPLAQRNTELLNAATEIYYSRGMIKEGNEAAASLLQNFRRNMTLYGGMAVAAAENGNMQQAGELLTQAYAYVPDGNTVTAQRSGSGVQLVTVGPDGKPKPGREVNLPDANAVRNAVGYATDMDKWAGHLLNERKANAEIELGQGRLAETVRHNRVAEGLQGASLAESRAARGEARSARQRAEDREVSGEAASQAYRLAATEARRAEEALGRLSDDADPAAREAAEKRLEAARGRAEDLETKVPTRLAATVNSIENQDAAAGDRRAALDNRLEESRLRRAAAAEVDPIKKRKLEAEIAGIQARTARTQAGGTGRAAGALSFADRNTVDTTVDELGADLKPAEREQARNAASLLGGYVTGVSARDVAQLGLAAQRGEVIPLPPRDGKAVARINGREIELPLSVMATLMPAAMARTQREAAERTRAAQPGVVSQVATGIGNQLSGRNRPEPAPLAAEDPTGGTSLSRAAQIVSTRLQGGTRLNEMQVDRIIRETAARTGVNYETLKRAVTR